MKRFLAALAILELLLAAPASAYELKGTTRTLTSGTSIAIDWGAANWVQLTPAHSPTITASNVVPGVYYFLQLTTSGTTSYTLTFGSGFSSVSTYATGTVSGVTCSLAFVGSAGGTLREAAGTCRTIVLGAPASYQASDADLDALAGLSSTGLIARTGAGTAAVRTVTGTASEITVANGDGVSANPTLSLPASIDLGAKIVELPNGTAPTSGDCDDAAEAGRAFVDTNASTGQQWYVCEGAAGWVLQGGAGGSGDITDVWTTSSGNVNGLIATAGDSFDASAADSTSPCKVGTTAPATCAVGDCFFDSDATAGLNDYGCTAVNTWTLEGDGGGGGAGDIEGVTAGTGIGGGGTSGTVTVSLADPGRCDYRLTLTSGTPVTTSDVTAATSVYVTPYKGNLCTFYDGVSAWVTRSFSEITISIAGFTASKPFDVFCYDSGGSMACETLVWTNDTTRATAVALQNGVYVKSGATTRRLMGTFRTTASTGQTEDSITNRLVANVTHPEPRRIVVNPGYSDNNSATALSGVTSTTLTSLNGGTADSAGYIDLLGTTQYEWHLDAHCFGSGTIDPWLGVGDSSTTSASCGNQRQLLSTASHHFSVQCSLPATTGYRTVHMLARTSSGTTTCYADLGRGGSAADMRTTVLRGIVLQ